MTNKRNDDDTVVIRTRRADRTRSETLFVAGYQAGASRASKEMLSMTAPEQMAYRKNIKKEKPSEKTLKSMLDYFESNFDN